MQFYWSLKSIPELSPHREDKARWSARRTMSFCAAWCAETRSADRFKVLLDIYLSVTIIEPEQSGEEDDTSWLYPWMARTLDGTGKRGAGGKGGKVGPL